MDIVRRPEFMFSNFGSAMERIWVFLVCKIRRSTLNIHLGNLAYLLWTQYMEYHTKWYCFRFQSTFKLGLSNYFMSSGFNIIQASTIDLIDWNVFVIAMCRTYSIDWNLEYCQWVKIEIFHSTTEGIGELRSLVGCIPSTECDSVYINEFKTWFTEELKYLWTYDIASQRDS